MTEDLRNVGAMRLSWRERINKHVRELRRNQTEQEAFLWEMLRNRKFDGFKFLRQHPIVYSYYRRPLYFVADFYCAEKKLVLEVDGSVHDFQKEYDEQRDFIITKLGMTVLRIKNGELNDMEALQAKLRGALKEGARG